MNYSDNGEKMKKIKNLLISLTCVGLLFVFGCEPHSHSSDSSTSTEETQIAGSPIKISSFGHPNCANAVEDPHVQIKDFVFRKSGMSYKWASSTKLEVWGLDHEVGNDTTEEADQEGGRVFVSLGEETGF